MGLRETRLMLRGQQEELKQQRMELAIKIDSNIKAAKQFLATSAIKPVGEVDLVATKSNIDEAVQAQTEYRQICQQIATLEEELK